MVGSTSLDTLLESLLSTPIWGVVIGLIILVVGNKMAKKPALHNTILIIAGSVCIAAIYFTPPVSIQATPWKVCWTVLSALVVFGVCWLLWDSDAELQKKTERNAFDRLKALLGQGERMLAAFWAGKPPTLRAVNRFNRKLWRSADRQAFGLSLAAWDRFKTPLEDQMPMLMTRAELQGAGLLRSFADDRNGVIAFERLYTLVERLKELLSAITADRNVTPPPSAPTAVSAEPLNPLIVALEELDAIYREGDHLATLFQCKGARLPTFPEAVAWNDKAIEFAKRKIFADHISAQDWAKFKENWNFADCQRLERVLREHRCLDNATATQCSTLRFLWGRVKRLGELIGKIKGIAPDENETPIESLTNFLLTTHSLLDASANLARLLPQAERHDLIASIRQFLRKTAPEYVARFNEIVEAPPARTMEFPPDFTEEDKEEWTRTRREPCDQLHAIAAYLTRIVSDLRSKLPS